MRVIAGYARGTPLQSPRGDLRPTCDRVKESLFASLEPILGQVVVDLFAGSGALGLEALSRGASAVYCVERDRRYCQTITRNHQRVLRAIAEPGTFEVVCGDARDAARMLAHVCPALVLADPPYDPPPGAASGPDLLAHAEFRAWVGDALFVLEQGLRPGLPPAALAGWEVVRERRIGDTVLWYLRGRKG